MIDDDTPLEPFKRAMTATMRALAEDEELDVTFGAGAPAARGNRLRVPLPVLGSSAAEINTLRGVGDQMALNLRHHDQSTHARYAPPGVLRRRCFNGLKMLEWRPSAVYGWKAWRKT